MFLLIMLPNFVWFAVPAPNDILRKDSATPLLDMAASVCQVLMVLTLCLLVNRAGPSKRRRQFFPAAFLCCAAYYAAWFFYYRGAVNVPVILSLCLFPCAAFLFYEAGCSI